ncbi:MAG: HAD family hydrolase [Polyangiales bacterium]
MNEIRTLRLMRYTAGMRVILFDIDGTLLRGHGAGSRAMQRAGRRVCGDAFALEGIVIGGGLDPLIYAEAARNMGLADAHALHDAFRDCYLEELALELAASGSRLELLPGVVELLGELQGKPDIAVGVLTGNYRRGATAKFEAVGLGEHFFLAGAYGDDASSRPGLVPVALARVATALGRETHPRDVVIVGDTPRDVDCALQNGSRCLAVETGYHTREELLAAGAHCVVADLRDPAALSFLLD